MSLSKNGRSLVDSVISRSAARGMVQEEQRRRWNEETEEEYLERVRERARDQAKEIIAQAQSQAEALKQEAYREGLKIAEEEAEASLAGKREELSNRFQDLMQALEREKEKIWEVHRQDILQLVRFAVEKVIGSELESRKQEVLGNLLGEALKLLEDQREISVKVHEEDLPTMRELIGLLQDKGTLEGVWTVHASKDLAPGDLILETREGRIDNSLGSRLESVRGILEQIDLKDVDPGSL